jgi:hypothetical protein
MLTVDRRPGGGESEPAGRVLAQARKARGNTLERRRVPVRARESERGNVKL